MRARSKPVLAQMSKADKKTQRNQTIDIVRDLIPFMQKRRSDFTKCCCWRWSAWC